MHVGEKRKKCSVLVGNPEKGRTCKDLDVDGTTIIKSTL